jgi:hypothetical protein
MARGGHGLPKVSNRPALPDPSTSSHAIRLYRVDTRRIGDVMDARFPSLDELRFVTEGLDPADFFYLNIN